MKHPARFTFAFLLGLAAACGDRDRASGGADTAAAATDSAPAASGLHVTFPGGFTGTVFADTIGGARHAAAAPNGDLYVNTWRSPYDTTRRTPSGGYVVALRDSDGDGRADVIRRFGPTSESGSHGGTGIAVHRGAVYVEADSSILRYRLAPDELVPAGSPDTIVAGLTTEGGHPMHPFAIDSSGNLFVNLGSDTNACQVRDRQPESPGQEPCRELAERAGIWRFSADRVGQRFSRNARYATGIRNAGGLAAGPGGVLYVTQHGRDQLAENWPGRFDWKQSANLPAEELLRVERGGDYGWPYCYYDPERRARVLAPEYGGDGTRVGRCGEKREPVAVFPAHWAPNALAFYGGTAFPEKYRGGAFIAFHGSWNRAPEPQEGYNVVFQPMADGRAAGEFEVFGDGFAGARKEPGLAAHRPAGLAVGPDGSLYITDDAGGRVWRVGYGRVKGEG
ncbi:MAG TPA: PQQ-dependent sugar dehydrogenase [Gemmatimonadales bacterium]|nr:PQQ-dependent sugar dehydrogenase [Gemmatimonadales bacterium]